MKKTNNSQKKNTAHGRATVVNAKSRRWDTERNLIYICTYRQVIFNEKRFRAMFDVNRII